jgi:DNA-binding IclR family transcriptional regulator
LDEARFDTRSVLGKVMVVLTSFTVEDHGVTLAELTRRTGLPKGTLHRVLADLVEVRLLDRTDEGYRLSGQVFELGMRASVERQLLEVATPFMEDLYERTHETVHLAVPEGQEVVYVAKIGGHRQVRSPSRIGGRMPLHCTAIGKALLASSPPQLLESVVAQGLARRTPRTITAPGMLARQLASVVETGIAYEYEESAVGIVCAAAAVLDRDDRPIAAISATGPVTRFHPEKHAAAVRAAAAGISATLARRSSLQDHRS